MIAGAPFFIRNDAGRRMRCVVVHCDCGWTGVVEVYRALKAKRCRACNAAKIRRDPRTHGGTGTPEYRVWSRMRERCHNPRNSSYATFGGRGIQVCGRWRDDFAAFLADVGPRPSADHRLIRLDSTGDYAPDNCRWATAAEHTATRRRQRGIEFQSDLVGRRVGSRVIAGVPFRVRKDSGAVARCCVVRCDCGHSVVLPVWQALKNGRCKSCARTDRDAPRAVKPKPRPARSKPEPETKPVTIEQTTLPAGRLERKRKPQTPRDTAARRAVDDLERLPDEARPKHTPAPVRSDPEREPTPAAADRPEEWELEPVADNPPPDQPARHTLTMTLEEWEEFSGIPEAVLASRLAAGHSLRYAVSTPVRSWERPMPARGSV